MLTAPATAAMASPPAVDQYTQHLPTAGGGNTLAGGETPIAHPGQLSSKTQAALSGPEGQVLAPDSHRPELGCADAHRLGQTGRGGRGRGTGASVDGRSLATVVTDTAGTQPASP